LRSYPHAFAAALLLASMPWFVPLASAKEISFMSASPYQLADLIRTKNPGYGVKIRANLIYPTTISGTVPVFIFLHGSGGRLARHQRFLTLARKLGFATLQIDSFGPRGVSSTIGSQSNVTAAMMTIDLLRALKFLAADRRTDARKIVVMGSSKGAIAALYASWNPIRQKVVGSLDFAAYLLLYPLCVAIQDGRVTTNPVRVFIGEKDNWTPAAPCVQQAMRMKRRGRDWTVTLYKDSYHAFDAPIGVPRLIPNAFSMVGCSVALRADGIEYETKSGLLLTREQRRRAFGKCVRRGFVKIGGPAAAAAAFFKDLEVFLRSSLQKK